MILHCAVHGRSGRAAACPLSRDVRRQWQRAQKRGKERHIFCVVEVDNPAHAAVCADDGPGLRDKEHERMVMSCLKSTIRSAKIKRTKALKRRIVADEV